MIFMKWNKFLLFVSTKSGINLEQTALTLFGKTIWLCQTNKPTHELFLFRSPTDNFPKKPNMIKLVYPENQHSLLNYKKSQMKTWTWLFYQQFQTILCAENMICWLSCTNICQYFIGWGGIFSSTIISSTSADTTDPPTPANCALSWHCLFH